MKTILKILQGEHAGRKYAFNGRGRLIVGRSSKATIACQDGQMSQNHFALDVDPPHVVLRDLRSTNGTCVNGDKVSEARLKAGDMILAGGTVFEFLLEGAPAAPKVEIKCMLCGRTETDEEKTYGASTDASYVCASCREEASQHPQPIPGFQILRQLGRGGMGVVHLARSQSDGKLVVVKVMLPDGAVSPQGLKMFMREMKVLASLSHPNIVPYADQGVCHGGLHYFVMDYVEGVDAKELAQKHGGKLGLSDALAITSQCLDALDYAHAKHFVHRDIKPQNILVSGQPGNYHARLLDFGLAKNFEEASSVSSTGQVKGTFQFMPPEQLRDCKNVGPRCDLYAIGAVFYYLLSGEYVFDFQDNSHPWNVILEEEVIPLKRRGITVAPELDAALLKALAREPSKRFGCAADMKRALLKASGASSARLPKV